MLLIFLRLAEDTMVFQNIPSQRRRDMTQALTTHMTEIYTFFLNTLQEHYQKYKHLVSLTFPARYTLQEHYQWYKHLVSLTIPTRYTLQEHSKVQTPGKFNNPHQVHSPRTLSKVQTSGKFNNPHQVHSPRTLKSTNTWQD